MNHYIFQFLGNEGFNSILKTKILIFGAGAGGSTIAYLLAQMGFVNLVIVDADDVNETDMSKSVIFNAYEAKCSPECNNCQPILA